MFWGLNPTGDTSPPTRSLWVSVLDYAYLSCFCTDTHNQNHSVPYMDHNLVEPYLNFGTDDPQFLHDEKRQISRVGEGSYVARRLSLRIIVQHSDSRGVWMIFVSQLIDIVP